MRELVAAGLELGERPLLLTADQGGPVRVEVDGVLEEISDVEGHGNQTRTCYRFAQ